MKKISMLLAATLTLFAAQENAFAQAAGKKVSGPYTLRNSAEFETPKGHFVLDPIILPDGNIFQPNVERARSFNFQLFSKDLKMIKENTVDVTSKLAERADFWKVETFNSKIYAFVREVFRESDNEGVSAIELDPKSLDVIGTSKNLFKSSNKVKMDLFSMVGVEAPGTAGFVYEMEVSENKSKFLCTYTLAPKEKNKKINHEVKGMYVIDENLSTLWGGEYEMPYPEARMDLVGYTVTNDGKVCVLTQVFEEEEKKEGKSKKTKPAYHFEVLVYQKGVQEPKKVEIRLDNFFIKEAYIYENSGKISIAGFYGQQRGAGVDGAYIVTLDVEKAVISRVNGGYYELPTEFIKSFMSDKAKKKAEEDMEENEDTDLELNFVRVRNLFFTPDGSTKIVAEIAARFTRVNSSGQTTYTYMYRDAIVMNIKGGKLEWVQRVPKDQLTSYPNGRGCGMKALLVGDNVHIFWKDKPENSKKAESEKPLRFGGTNGMLRGCMINAKGDKKYTDIVDVAPYDMHFDIKGFVKGGANNLVNTERRSRVNTVFSIDVKP
jgi:hypothetical protein